MNITTADGPSPGLFSEMLGQAAYVISEVQPYLPMYLHLILSALFPIFTGAHSSLVRPSSASKPPKKAKKDRRASQDDSDDDDDDESTMQKMEGLSPSDAIIFPLLAGSTLAGLYLLIKWMGPQMINKVLGWYFSSIAVFSVAKLLNDAFAVIESFCWPEYYADEAVIWHVSRSKRKAIEISQQPDSDSCSRVSPLPGILGRIGLPSSLLETLWVLRDLPGMRYSIHVHLAKVVSFKVKLTLRTIFSTFLGLGLVLISTFVSKAWYLTNLQGFAFSYSALQLMSPTTFGTGSLILAALFFYDIYFVFFTPMMVTVATSLDVPIKLLFPRPIEEGETIRRLAMLGLGDIVLPGIMIGLALRFDLYMHYLKKQKVQSPSVENGPSEADQTPKKQSSGQKLQKAVYLPVTGHWGNTFWTSSWTGRSLLFVTPPKALQQASPALRRTVIPNFRKPYFYASIAGYVAGMCATLGVMQVFHHAQPALLYLVPSVLSSIWLTGAVRGELKQMHEFSEASEEEDDDDNEQKKKAARHDSESGKDQPGKEDNASWWGRSFFSSTSREKNAKYLEKRLSKSVSSEAQHDGDSKSKKNGSSKKDKKQSVPKEMFLFSITHEIPRWARSSRTESNESKLDDAVVVDDSNDVSDSGENVPRWRGARVSEDSKEERPEKRLRTR